MSVLSQNGSTDVSGQWGCGHEWEWLNTQCNSMEYSLISSSVCSQYLPWLRQIQRHPNDNDAANSSAATILISGSGEKCSFARKEKDLTFLVQLASFSSAKCQSLAVSFICNYFYRPCMDKMSIAQWPTRDECLAVKQDHCFSEWTILEQQIKAGDYCLGIPNCNTLPQPRRKTTNTIQVLSNSIN